MQPASNSYVLLPHVLLPLYKNQLSNILTSVVPMLSCGGEGRVQKCLCMCQVPLVTCILLCYAKIMVNSVYLLKDHYSMWDTYARFWCKNNIALTVTVCVGLFEAIDKLQRERLHQSRANNSCKWRAEHLCHSLVIVHTEHGQWQTSFMWEKSSCLAEVIIMEQILQKFPKYQKSWGNWACANSVYQALFSLPTHESLKLHSYLSRLSLCCNEKM